MGAFLGRDNAVSEREDAVLDKGGSRLRVYHGIQPEGVGEGSALPYSSILAEGEAIFFIIASRVSVSLRG